jgi:hypothetical protein
LSGRSDGMPLGLGYGYCAAASDGAQRGTPPPFAHASQSSRVPGAATLLRREMGFHASATTGKCRVRVFGFVQCVACRGDTLCICDWECAGDDRRTLGAAHS